MVCTEMRFILCTWLGEICSCSCLIVLPGIGGGCSSTSVAWTLEKGGRELTDFGSAGDSAAAPAQSDGREGEGGRE